MKINEDEIRGAIASIAKRTLLRIRGLAHRRDFEAIDAEAYHVHNLPGLLCGPLSRGALKYYREIECTEYLARSEAGVSELHKDEWDTIDKYLSEAEPKGAEAEWH